jgi:DNA polymerase I
VNRAAKHARNYEDMFSETWVVDFEFKADPGERPWPLCMVAQEVKSGRVIRLWRAELLALNRAPFDCGPQSLFVAYFASAELGCFLELGWHLPANVLDLYAEHRIETNGEKTLSGNSLLGALALRGLGHIDAGEKDEMRRLILERHQWSDVERRKIVDYCASDVTGTAALRWPLRLIGPEHCTADDMSKQFPGWSEPVCRLTGNFTAAL